jgi:hypothetical protein
LNGSELGDLSSVVGIDAESLRVTELKLALAIWLDEARP